MSFQKAIEERFLYNALTQGYLLEKFVATHEANEIFLNVNGIDMSLQYAINNGIFGGVTLPYRREIVKGHQANEINIEFEGDTMTIEELFNSGELSYGYGGVEQNDWTECSAECGEEPKLKQ